MKKVSSFRKKSILIFGGFGKLGKYIIKNLLFEKNEFKLYIFDLNSIENKNISEKVNFIQCNANNISEINEKLKNVVEESSELTILNLIGFDFPVNKNSLKFETPVSISEDDLRKSLELNLETSHKIVQAVMNFKKKSHFIFFSSIYSSKPTNSNLYTKTNKDIKKYKPFIYGASKAALEKLSNDLSTYLPSKKSRINTISLGGIDIDLPEEFVKKYSEWSPQKSMISPASLIKLLSWLIFESPEELNGCILKLDGGLSNT